MQFPSSLLRACWFLVGPTAGGKTATSLELAGHLNGEILSLDSMSIYRHMDIGTAKPTAAEQARVPHHLIDIVDPWDDYSVSEYMTAAEGAVRNVLGRGKVPIFVGGTGLYLRSLLRGVFEGPPADWNFRHQLEQQAILESPGWLHQRLAQIDPASAARLHPADQRRIIRALEIHHLTGQAASSLQNEVPLPPEDRPKHVYWLSPPRDWLYRRIDQRVTAMMEGGLQQEVASLQADPRGLSRTASMALGYRELLDHLAGSCSLAEAVTTIQLRTRQFAKRQLTWFRNLVECQEFPIRGDEQPTELAAELFRRAVPE